MTSSPVFILSYFVDYTEFSAVSSKQPKCKIDANTFVRGAVLEIPAGVSYMCVNLQFDDTNHRDSAIIAKYNSNLTWVAFGDSITAHTYTSGYDNWVALSSYKLSLPVLNYGQGGTGYSRYVGDNSYVDKLNKITSDADLITFFGSFNDMAVLSDTVVIGSASDVYVEGADNSLAACMNYCYDYVLTNFPNAKIAVIAPTPWAGSNPDNPNAKHSQYVAVMKEICENKGIPFLDLYQNSGLTPWDEEFRNKYFDTEGVHPNAEGMKIIEKKITPFLQTVLNG